MIKHANSATKNLLIEHFNGVIRLELVRVPLSKIIFARSAKAKVQTVYEKLSDITSHKLATLIRDDNEEGDCFNTYFFPPILSEDWDEIGFILGDVNDNELDVLIDPYYLDRNLYVDTTALNGSL